MIVSRDKARASSYSQSGMKIINSPRARLVQPRRSHIALPRPAASPFARGPLPRAAQPSCDQTAPGWPRVRPRAVRETHALSRSVPWQCEVSHAFTRAHRTATSGRAQEDFSNPGWILASRLIGASICHRWPVSVALGAAGPALPTIQWPSRAEVSPAREPFCPKSSKCRPPRLF